MIPSGLAGILSFLLLLAPGIVWELQRGRYLPGVKETALIEASRIVLASLVATAIAGALLAWLWLPLYEEAIARDGAVTGALAATIRYVAAVVVTSTLACGLALISASVKWRGTAPIAGLRVWHRTFVEWNGTRDTKPRLIVELLDGTVWRGTLLAFDADPEDAQRNIALGRPLKRKRPGGNGFEQIENMWHTVVLPEGQIKSIRVGYPDTEI